MKRYAVQTYDSGYLTASRYVPAARFATLEDAISEAKDRASKISDGTVGVWDSIEKREIDRLNATRVSGQEAL